MLTYTAAVSSRNLRQTPEVRLTTVTPETPYARLTRTLTGDGVTCTTVRSQGVALALTWWHTYRTYSIIYSIDIFNYNIRQGLVVAKHLPTNRQVVGSVSLGPPGYTLLWIDVFNLTTTAPMSSSENKTVVKLMFILESRTWHTMRSGCTEQGLALYIAINAYWLYINNRRQGLSWHSIDGFSQRQYGQAIV